MSNGAGAPAVMWAVCFRREDAVAFDEKKGVFTFESGLEKINVYKTQLVSLEFPMSQRTIEEQFSRFYYSEGFQVGPMGRRIVAHEMVPMLDSIVQIAADLPLLSQRLTVSGGTGVLTITTTDDSGNPSPHGLFVGPDNACIADVWAAINGESIRLVIAGVALPPPIQMPIVLTCNAITYVDSTQFTIDIGASTTVDGSTGFLYSPAIRTPAHAAALVQWVFAQFPTLNSYDVSFDAPTMRTTVAARGKVEPGTRLSLTAGSSSGLLAWVGFPCDVECTAAGDYRLGVGWLGAAQQPDPCFPCDRLSLRSTDPDRNLARVDCVDPGLRRATLEQLSLPAQGFRENMPLPPGAGPPVAVLRRECDRYMDLACQSNMWVPCGCVRVQPGWYTPVVRPSGIAEPLNAELELRMSPLRFAPPAANQQLSGTTTTIHAFVLETPTGVIVRAPIEMGHYTPHIMAETIEDNVKKAAIDAGLSWPTFSATFHEATSQFIFADVGQRPFGLRFEDPFMFDPRRVGFEAKRYFGSFAYASELMTLPRRASRGDDSICPEILRLSLVADALLPGVGVVAAATAGTYVAVPSGGGSGAVLRVEAADATTISSVTVLTAGTGYLVGQLLTIPAAALGAGSAAVVVTLGYDAFVRPAKRVPCCPPDPGLSTDPNALLTSILTTLLVANVGTNVVALGSTSQGVGVGAVVNVTVAAGPAITDITVTNQGAGYAVGDIVTIASGALGVGSTALNIQLSAHDFDQLPSNAKCRGWPVNWYSVTDGGSTRRYNLIGTPPRTVRVRCIDCPVGNCTTSAPADPPAYAMNLQTALPLPNNTPGTTMVPFALPYQRHDVVVLSSISDNLSYYALVLEDAGVSATDGNGDAVKLLSLYVPGVAQTDIGCGWDWTVQAAPSYSPFSMAIPIPGQSCVDLQPIPPRVLGLPEGATLWHLDLDNTIVAPSLMDLEHVDYILMDLGWDFLRKTDTFQLAGRDGNTVGFAKLVLYPQYQVHGLLPRDLVTTSMDSPVRFQVKFTNPDLSPYRLNGRTFSFSLQFTCPQGSM
jgi:hypothetical protein